MVAQPPSGGADPESMPADTHRQRGRPRGRHLRTVRLGPRKSWAPGVVGPSRTQSARAGGASLPVGTPGSATLGRHQASARAPTSNRPARIAELEIRFGAVELRAPKTRGRLPNVRLWAVWAREPAPPPGIEPVEWM